MSSRAACIDDRRVVSIPALVAALRREYVTDSTIRRVLASALGVDDATARDLAGGRTVPLSDAPALQELLADARDRRDWPAVVELIGRIAAGEQDLARRARYFYTMAAILRDELGEPLGAAERFEEALDCDPSLTEAFDGLSALLGAHGEWKRLERAHRKMIARIRDRGDAAQQARLLHALARLYRDHLGAPAAAIEALRLAVRLAPELEAAAADLRALTGE
jgi:tetratricopeptide (TPR) repeat protein